MPKRARPESGVLSSVHVPRRPVLISFWMAARRGRDDSFAESCQCWKRGNCDFVVDHGEALEECLVGFGRPRRRKERAGST